MLRLNYATQIEKIKAVDQEILTFITDEKEYANELESSLENNDVFYDTLAKIDYCLTERTSSSSKFPFPMSASPVQEQVKLPKIELPKFNGDISKWQTFWDQFESSVHNQVNLSDVDKFSYLRSLLNASASECISGLALTNDNYHEAVILLKERFGNRQLLINTHMDSFIKLQPVKSMNHIRELRNVYDQTEIIVRNLKSLDVETETYGAFLVPTLTQKLPNELRMIMSREFKNNIWEFDKVLSIFKEELQAKERCSLSASSNNITRSGYSEKLPYSTMNLHQHQYQPPQKRNCLFCDREDHSSYHCKNVTDINSRISILRRRGLCFLCFQKGHNLKFCRSSYRCKKCGSRHNISICDTDSQKTSNAHYNSEQKTSNAHNNSEQKTDIQKTSNAHTNSEQKSILLQTGRSLSYNVSGERTASIRLLFDTGSQRSCYRIFKRKA